MGQVMIRSCSEFRVPVLERRTLLCKEGDVENYLLVLMTHIASEYPFGRHLAFANDMPMGIPPMLESKKTGVMINDEPTVCVNF